MMKVIGTIGQNGSGKDEVLKYLHRKYFIPYISTGDMVREVAARKNILPTRENLGRLTESYFRQFGKGHFVTMAANKILRNQWHVTGISGIRSTEDIEVVKEIFGRGFILIHVYISDQKIRFRRMVERGSERDPRTYEEFLKLDEAEERQFHISEAASQANYTVNNDGTVDDMELQIDELVNNRQLVARLS
jgi:dephospho-CoA kinase